MKKKPLNSCSPQSGDICFGKVNATCCWGWEQAVLRVGVPFLQEHPGSSRLFEGLPTSALQLLPVCKCMGFGLTLKPGMGELPAPTERSLHLLRKDVGTSLIGGSKLWGLLAPAAGRAVGSGNPSSRDYLWKVEGFTRQNSCCGSIHPLLQPWAQRQGSGRRWHYPGHGCDLAKLSCWNRGWLQPSIHSAAALLYPQSQASLTPRSSEQRRRNRARNGKSSRLGTGLGSGDLGYCTSSTRLPRNHRQDILPFSFTRLSCLNRNRGRNGLSLRGHTVPSTIGL